jgi:predicted nucleic acid-binding protein
MNCRRDRRLSTLLGHIRVWPLEIEVSRFFGEIHDRLRELGKALSQVDMMEAALAIHMDLTILTSDGDFRTLPRVKIENWL